MQTKYQDSWALQFRSSTTGPTRGSCLRYCGSGFRNQREPDQAHPAAAGTIPANFTRNTFLPFHSGSSRWYHKTALVSDREIIGPSGSAKRHALYFVAVA